MYIYLSFWDRVCLLSPGWLAAHDPLVPASQTLERQVCSIPHVIRIHQVTRVGPPANINGFTQGETRPTQVTPTYSLIISSDPLCYSWPCEMSHLDLMLLQAGAKTNHFKKKTNYPASSISLQQWQNGKTHLPIYLLTNSVLWNRLSGFQNC